MILCSSYMIQVLQQMCHNVQYCIGSAMERGLDFISRALLSVCWTFLFIRKVSTDLCHGTDHFYHLANPVDMLRGTFQISLVSRKWESVYLKNINKLQFCCYKDFPVLLP